MTPGAIALTIIFAFVALGGCIGFLAGARRTMDLEQWTVGGRGFGPVLVYLLMAGEVYTTFSFLGASGWAYSRGGPTLYVVAYVTLSYIVAFFIQPPLWELGRAHQLQTQSDFFRVRYESPALAAFVSLVGVVFLLPYYQLQVTGLGLIVSTASFDTIGRAPAMAISVLVIAGFVFTSGVRAVAWVSILKDALMLFAAISVGIGIPYIHFGGIGPMFAALQRAHPSHLTMPGATSDLGHTWFVSTVLLSSLGLFMWPHYFGATFTARSADTLRRNAVVMPLYTITVALIFIVGFSAVLIVPGLSNGDLALLASVRQTFPAWFLGIIGGAGALTAMAPAAIIVLTASTLFAKNLVRPTFAPAMSDDAVARLARVMVVVLSAVSLYLAIYSSSTLVSLLLLGYGGVTQFFPGVVLGLYSRRVTATGVFAGLAAGVASVAFLALTNRDPFHGWSAGFLALCLNVSILVTVSLCTQRTTSTRPAPAALT